MDIPNHEKQYGKSFSAFFTRTSFRTNKTRQKALLYFSLIGISQTLFCTKLCTEVYHCKGKRKAVKQLYIGSKLSVQCACYVLGLCTLNILGSEISLSCGKFRKHGHEPLLGHGNTSDRGLPFPSSGLYA
jgi:hypothetical protein